MKTLGENEIEFPDQDSREESDNWSPVVRRVALARQVLAVAQTRIEGKWGAYCDAVPGKNHDDEEALVLQRGCKLHEPFARAMFPCFDGIPYAR